MLSLLTLTKRKNCKQAAKPNNIIGIIVNTQKKQYTEKALINIQYIRSNKKKKQLQ